MADAFYEVDEQLRAARMQVLLRKGWPFAAGLLAVAVILALGAWGLNQNELAQAARASGGYAQAMRLLAAGDVAGADRRFADLARSGPRAYRALAGMQAAGLAEKRRDTPAAIALLDQAAQAAPNLLLGDSARLEAAYTVMDRGDYADTRGRLLTLAGAGRPYRIMAREALGMVELANGRIAEARGDLQIVSLSSEATEAARNRASAALGLIQSGAWPSIAALAKASASLAPQAPPPTPNRGVPGQAGMGPAGSGPAQADQSQADQSQSDQSQSAPTTGGAQ